MLNKFEPHQIEWTREKANRMWQYYSGRRSTFSKQVGDSILEFIEKSGVSLRGKIIDYGCGPGFLLEKLLNKGHACEGAEFSTKTIDVVNKKLSGNPDFKGVTLLHDQYDQLDNDTYDMVFFIETIEHIIDDELVKAIGELHRILKKGATIVITTPNEEDIEGRKVICPECGCIFHRVQHVSSWSVNSLTSLMESEGFSTTNCVATTFRPSSRLNIFREFFKKIEGGHRPHLIYIGKKV